MNNTTLKNNSPETYYNIPETPFYSLTDVTKKLSTKNIHMTRKTFLRLIGFGSGHEGIFTPDELGIKKIDNKYLIPSVSIDKFIKGYTKYIDELKNDYVEIEIFAKANNVSRRTVERLIANGDVKKRFYNKKTYIKKSEVICNE